jgi:enoyl-CoA hydratase/carnithine racemase
MQARAGAACENDSFECHAQNTVAAVWLGQAVYSQLAAEGRLIAERTLMMSYETICYEISEHILTITLNRPDKLNAFTLQMAHELMDAFERANQDSDVRAIIVTGAGNAFSAGMDLSVGGNIFGLDESLEPTLADMRERLSDPAIANGVRDTGGKLTLRIFESTKPVIGAINGAAVGIGVTMTLPMDIRIASERARFGFVFGKVGIVTEACSSWFLPRIVGVSQALEWCYSAEVFDAAEALRGRLVKSVVPHEQLLDEARRIAHTITQGRSAVSLAMMRQMLWRNSAAAHPLMAHHIDSLAVFYLSQKDGKEGVSAFLQKRPPNFSSRVPEDLPPFYEEWCEFTDDIAGRRPKL